MSGRRSPPTVPEWVGGAAAGEASAGTRRLRAGCHLLEMTVAAAGLDGPLGRFAGTLRVQRDDAGVMASGDLYEAHAPAGKPDPAAGIPVFDRARYRLYVRVTEIVEAEGVRLGFERFRLEATTNEWAGEGSFTAVLRWEPAPAAYPSARDFLRGELIDEAGRCAGELALGWVSPFLRRAVVEIDSVGDAEPPLEGAGQTANWRGLLETAGWDVTVSAGEQDAPGPADRAWSAAELHALILDLRDRADLDSEWRYWLVCVPRLEGEEQRGLMFDRDAVDTNKVPREAAAIASHWTFPDEDPWGLVRGLRFGAATDPYFRTAVHEIGHAMGLQHGPGGGIMTPTDAIAVAARDPQRFPQNIEWSLSSRDRRRLGHMPDPWVRPGGLPFGSAAPPIPEHAPVAPGGLRLTVTSLLAEVPVGAPVRLDVSLENGSGQPVSAPATLSMKAANLTGTVTGPSTGTRTFRPLLRSTEPHRLAPLAPGETRRGSVTLLRGGEGPLFAGPGRHGIAVRLEWEVAGSVMRLDASTAVEVLPVVDGAHAAAAQHVNATADAMLVLAIGGDHLREGIAAVGAALENRQLRPHFAYTEARRLASPFHSRAPDLAAADRLIDGETVMSTAELDKASRLLESGAERGASVPRGLVGTLSDRAAAVDALPAARRLGLL